ncbi:MAG: response regulator [Candidatus Promineifilaceae bacterium]
MEEVKQILVVDDYFQMLEFLRSVLEFSHHEYQVLAVPSAEEGLFELRRTAFDLVITDVRLPGMSGFDLVRKIKALNADIPIIMITAYSTDQGKKEADDLGVMRYFKKPLDPDELLATVHTLLYGVVEAAAENLSEPPEVTLSLDIRHRLESLRSDTGARHVMLSNISGQILYDGGIGEELDLPELAAGIAESMEAGFRLADRLESEDPFTIHYQVGKKYDLYFANAGRDYFVSIFFDSQSRRGRLGTIWVFAQRAINDLQIMLAAQEPVVAPPILLPGELTSVPKTADTGTPSPAAVELTQEEAAPEVSPMAVETETPLTAEPEPVEEVESLSLEEIREMLGIENAEEVEAVDLDSFWDDALEETDQPKLNSSGMSLEEARQQGLIPAEFEQPGRKTDAD